MYFSLKQPSSKSDTLILLRYYISKKEGRFVFSTKLFISPKDWNPQTKLPILKRGRTDLSIINKTLQDYITFFEKSLYKLQLDNKPISKDLLKYIFNKEFKQNQAGPQKHIYFTKFVDEFLLSAPEQINRNTKRYYSKTEITHLKKINNRVKDFESYTNKKIKLQTFTINVYDELLSYFLATKKYSVNYTGGLIKNIKVLLKKAQDLKNEVHQDYTKTEFSVIKEDAISIALSENELQNIFEFDFSFNPVLENCRDLAIIGAWTGLRVSDLMSLPKINIEDNFITVQPKKTRNTSGVKVVIPLHHHIKLIIKKRGTPTPLADAYFNRQIKIVCQEVGLTQLVKGSLNNKKTNRKEAGVYPKYKLVSSHTLRRSFATNVYKMGFPTLSIMKITGHSSEKTFLSYIKVTPQEHAEKLLAHWQKYYKL